jgi:hypothetical protein
MLFGIRTVTDRFSSSMRKTLAHRCLTMPHGSGGLLPDPVHPADDAGSWTRRRTDESPPKYRERIRAELHKLGYPDEDIHWMLSQMPLLRKAD